MKQYTTAEEKDDDRVERPIHPHHHHHPHNLFSQNKGKVLDEKVIKKKQKYKPNRFTEKERGHFR